MNRIIIQKRRKRRRVLKIMVVFLLLIIVIAGCSAYQYYQGLASSGGANPSSEQNKQEFKGADIENNLGKVNILLLGVDSRGEEQSRTDTIMIAQYDPKENKAKLVSVMRDIYVEIPDHNSYKINTAYFLGGPELLRKTIKENLDVDIHYYALIDFKGFEKVIDALAPKGIEIEVEKRMSRNINVVLEPGVQHLDGQELLQYARFRYDAEGDFGRVKRQQKVVTALKDQLISFSGVAKLPKLVGTAQPYIETNLSGVEIMGLLKDFIINSPDDIETLRIPIDNSYTDASYEHAGAVLEIDKEKNIEALDEFLDGTSKNEKDNVAIDGNE
ncbi:LCP family protein [Robertmurraya sp. Marseille-Q9965]